MNIFSYSQNIIIDWIFYFVCLEKRSDQYARITKINRSVVKIRIKKYIIERLVTYT